MPSNKKTIQTESDSTYLLKLVLYVILGSFWLKLGQPLMVGPLSFNGLPIGLLIGMLFASHDHFQVDRKIEYAVLIVAAVVSYFLPSGLVI